MRTSALLATVILLVVCPARAQSPSPAATASGPLTVSGAAAAEELVGFLRNTLKRSGVVYDRMACIEGKGCAVDELKGVLPTHSWRLLAFAGLYSLKASKPLLEEMKAELKVIRSLTSYEMDGAPEAPYPVSFAEIFSLHQSYEAYRISRDPAFLNYFLAGILKSQRYLAISEGLVVNPQRGAMLIATFARQLAQASTLADDEKARPAIVKEFGLSGADTLQGWKDNLIRQSSRQLEQAEKVARDEMKSAESSGVSSPEQIDPRYDGCFVQWGRAALYDATKDAAVLARMKSYFDSGAVTTNDLGPQGAVAIQQLLPCIHALLSLEQEVPSYKDKARQLLEKGLFWYWDAEKRPICAGKGGLLTVNAVAFGDGGVPAERCDGNMLTTGDAAWTSFLLTKVAPTKFDIAPAPALATPTPQVDPTASAAKSGSLIK